MNTHTKKALIACLIALSTQAEEQSSIGALLIAIKKGDYATVEKHLNTHPLLNTVRCNSTPLIEAIHSLEETISYHEQEYNHNYKNHKLVFKDLFKPLTTTLVLGLVFGVGLKDELESDDGAYALFLGPSTNTEEDDDDDKKEENFIEKSFKRILVKSSLFTAGLWLLPNVWHNMKVATRIIASEVAHNTYRIGRAYWYNKAIDNQVKIIYLLLRQPNIDFTIKDQGGECAIDIIRRYKNKTLSQSYKLIWYAIEQTLLDIEQ